MYTLSAERFEDHYPLLPLPLVIPPFHIEFELKERAVSFVTETLYPGEQFLIQQLDFHKGWHFNRFGFTTGI